MNTSSPLAPAAAPAPTMYETLGCLLAILFPAAVVGAVVWFIRSLQGRRDLQQRVKALEDEVAQLAAHVRAPSVASQGEASREVDSTAATGTSPPATEPTGERLDEGVPAGEGQPATVPAEDTLTAPLVERGPAAARSGLAEGEASQNARRHGAGERTGSAAPSPEPTGDAADAGTPPPEPRQQRPKIDWEQWLGVRGAAVLGAIAFALAGIYLVRLGIDRGLLSPIVRVSLGIIGGLAAIAGSQILRLRRYALLANALAGAGLVCLYAALWAARNLYGLIGDVTAAVFFLLCTAAGGTLSVRHRSQLVAVLGLIGGFATPLLTGSERDQPVQLFVYLILLNAAVVWVAQRNGWRLLPLFGALATIFYQGLWILGPMGERVGLGTMLLLGSSFALLGLGAWMRGQGNRGGTASDAPSPTAQRVAEALALAAPLAFGIYFAGTSDLSRASLPLFVLLLALSVAATVLARTHQVPAFAYAGAAATFGSSAAWFWRQLEMGRLDGWSVQASLLTVAAAVVLVLAQWILFELWRRRGDDGSRVAARTTLILGLGALVLAALATWNGRGPAFSCTLLGGTAIVVVLLRVTRWLAAMQPMQGAASTLLAVVVAGRLAAGPSLDAVAHLTEALVGVIALALLLLLLWWLAERQPSGEQEAKRSACLAVVLPSIVLVIALTGGDMTAILAMSLASLITVVALLAATRWRWGTMGALSILACALHHAVRGDQAQPYLVQAFALLLAMSTVFAVWPSFVAPRLLHDSRVAHRFSALVPWLWLPTLLALWQRRELLAWPAVGVLPLALATVQLAVVRRRVQRQAQSNASRVPENSATTEEQQRSSLRGDSKPQQEQTARLAWAAASALCLVAVAIPLQLDREWITVGWALQALAVLAVYRRVDHAGLKLFALLLASAVTLRLVLNPAVLSYHPVRSPLGLPVLNWLLYSYLVPAGALLIARRMLQGLELPRLRARERRLHTWRGALVPLSSLLLGAQAALVVFVWINLTIFDAFAPGRDLELSLQRLPMRDLALSLAWIAYALILLVLGVWRGARGVRSLSLVVMLAALAKVFFYDLAELTGILRVVSLLGLAVALLGISLLYQRFVFRPSHTEEEPPEPEQPNALAAGPSATSAGPPPGKAE